MKIINKHPLNPSSRTGEGGQMMILMVIIVAATTLSTIAFASFTIISGLRQVTDARATGAALFAADTGIECILFREFGNAPYENSGCPVCIGDCATTPVTAIYNGATFQFEFLSRRPSPDGIKEIVVWRSIGRDASGRAVRSLEITLTRDL